MISREPTPDTIFLLSPANLNGVRAKQLRSKRARFEAALAYHSSEGVAVAEAFSFMSALYFRGKIAYASRFARPAAAQPEDGVWIMAPGFGLVRPDWKIEERRMRKLRRTAVDPSVRAYRKPLENDLASLAERCNGETRFVLLGSIATGKYLDVLEPVVGDRLQFPAAFVGAGDMQRGAMMLRAAESGEELSYVGLDHRRSNSRSATRLRTKTTRADGTAGTTD